MNEVEVAVMLADISGSTALYEEVGNAEALRRVQKCLDMLREVVDRRGGDFISSKGDDVLCTFTDPNVALDVGVEVLETLRDEALSLHAGVDFGSVLRTEDDVFGDSVNMSARLAALAKSGEVLCSQELYDGLDPSHRSMLRFFGPRQFKGKTFVSNVYLFSDAPPGQATEIVFSNDPVLDDCESNGDSNRVKAALRFGGETFLCTAKKSVTMGRSEDRDIVVPLPWVSRSHATLEVRQDKIYLIDSSTSGTWIRFGDRPPLQVLREGLLMPGSCELSLAREPGNEGAQVISCKVLRPDETDETS